MNKSNELFVSGRANVYVADYMSGKATLTKHPDGKTELVFRVYKDAIGLDFSRHVYSNPTLKSGTEAAKKHITNENEMNIFNIIIGMHLPAE